MIRSAKQQRNEKHLSESKEVLPDELIEQIKSTSPYKYKIGERPVKGIFPKGLLKLIIHTEIFNGGGKDVCDYEGLFKTLKAKYPSIDRTQFKIRWNSWVEPTEVQAESDEVAPEVVTESQVEVTE